MLLPVVSVREELSRSRSPSPAVEMATRPARSRSRSGSPTPTPLVARLVNPRLRQILQEKVQSEKCQADSLGIFSAEKGRAADPCDPWDGCEDLAAEDLREFQEDFLKRRSKFQEDFLKRRSTSKAPLRETPEKAKKNEDARASVSTRCSTRASQRQGSSAPSDSTVDWQTSDSNDWELEFINRMENEKDMPWQPMPTDVTPETRLAPATPSPEQFFREPVPSLLPMPIPMHTETTNKLHPLPKQRIFRQESRRGVVQVMPVKLEVVSSLSPSQTPPNSGHLLSPNVR